MNRLFLTAIIAASPFAFASAQAPAPQAPTTASQAPKPPPPAVTIPIRELPSNQESGVDIDHFIGYPENGFPKIFNGMMTRTMLHAGSPYEAGPTGAVLEYRDDLSLATIEPHLETRLIESPTVAFYYVQDGAGVMDSGPGSKSYDLHNGVGVLLAPGAKYHFANKGDKPLSMIMLTWSNNEGLTVKQPIKVVDSNTVPLSSNRAHWVHSGRSMFGVNDGVNVTISPILIPPMSYAGPHAHAKGVEEIWVKVGSDTGYAILGSEIRKINGVGAFLSPPNGLTTHSSMNLNDQASYWLYISRRLPSTQQPAGAAPAASR